MIQFMNYHASMQKIAEIDEVFCRFLAIYYGARENVATGEKFSLPDFFSLKRQQTKDKRQKTTEREWHFKRISSISSTVSDDKGQNIL